MRYITYAVLVLCIFLILWGISIAGRGRFYEDYLSLDVMKSLRGLAAIGVIIHHISLEEAFKNAGELEKFTNAGYMLVSVFFFCSGYGLLKKLDENPDYMKGFLKKRLPVLIIPYYTSVVLYGLFYVTRGDDLAPLQWVTHIIGITLMNEYAWYPIILTIFYIAFYLVFRKEGPRIRKFIYILAVILGLGLIFCVNGHFLWWAGSEPNWWMNPNSPDMEKWWLQPKVFWLSGEWWVNSPIAFLLGMIYETYEEKLTAFFQRSYPVKLAMLIVITCITGFITDVALDVFGNWSEYNGNGPGIVDKMICLPTQYLNIIALMLLIIVITMKVHVNNPAIRFFGKYSLDTYMMNLMPILMFRPIFLDFPGRVVNNAFLGRVLFFICVFIVTIIFGVIYHKINELVRKWLFH